MMKNAFRYAAITTMLVAVPAFCADGAAVQLKSPDGALTMTLPAGWVQSKPSNPDIVIKANSPVLQICVNASLKIDITSFDAFVKSSHDLNVAVLKEVVSTDAKKITVNGQPAVRYDYTYVDGAHRWGRVEIIFQTSTRFVVVVVDGARSTFEAHKDEWVSLADGLAETKPPK